MAARSVARKEVHRSHSFIGVPTVLHVERTIEDAFEPEDTPDVLSAIRRITGHQGEMREIGSSLEWSAESEFVRRYVTLSERDGSTTIRGSANLSHLALSTFLPTMLVGLILTMIVFTQVADAGSAIGIVACFAALPSLYVVLRRVLKRISRTEARRLQEVVDELSSLGERSDG